jgi:hypothetical protein
MPHVAPANKRSMGYHPQRISPIAHHPGSCKDTHFEKRRTFLLVAREHAKRYGMYFWNLEGKMTNHQTDIRLLSIKALLADSTALGLLAVLFTISF